MRTWFVIDGDHHRAGPGDATPTAAGVMVSTTGGSACAGGHWIALAIGVAGLVAEVARA